MTGSMMLAMCLHHFWFGNYRFLSAVFCCTDCVLAILH